MGVLPNQRNFIFYSVVLHGLFFAFWIFTTTNFKTNTRVNSNPPMFVEIESLPIKKPSDRLRKQVVQTEKNLKTATTTDDAFLGEQTQRVSKQSVSMPKKGTAARTAQQKSAPVLKPALTATGALSRFGISIPTGRKEQPVAKQNPIEAAALTAQAKGEYVKGFANGEQTMLNTREYVFYGYFQRIRERLDRAWDKSLRDRLAKYFYRGRQLASETDYMTQLLVSLDKEGRITKVQVIGPSGTTDLDEAATKAFNDAGPFPNPPSGLVDTGGQIFVRWDFVLKT
jgi:TonB family protein